MSYAKLEEKLTKAKIKLMTKCVFISTIALSLRHVISTATPTADVNGITARYNPQYIDPLSVDELAGLVAHETWHVAFQHLSRRMARDPMIWNVAADYVIDTMLIGDGYQVPNPLLDSKYNKKWTTEAIYDDLMKTAKPPPKNMRLDIQGPDDGGSAIDSPIVDIIVRAKTQATMSSKGIGHLPDEVIRRIDELINPKLPWPVILNRFLDQRVRSEYSWARKNRRFSSVYLPSLHSEGLGHLTFAIDTSGSINNEQLRELLSEIQGIRDVFVPEKMTIIDCDSAIHNVWDIDPGTDIMSLNFTGNGGTSFLPVLNYVKENPTQALVYFTDLYGEEDLPEQDYPVLWICNSEHDPANIGETVYFNQ